MFLQQSMSCWVLTDKDNFIGKHANAAYQLNDKKVSGVFSLIKESIKDMNISIVQFLINDNFLPDWEGG